MERGKLFGFRRLRERLHRNVRQHNGEVRYIFGCAFSGLGGQSFDVEILRSLLDNVSLLGNNKPPSKSGPEINSFYVDFPT